MMRALILSSVMSSISFLPAPAQVAVGALHLTSPVTTSGWVAYVDFSRGGVQPVVTPSAAHQCGYSPAVQLLDTKTFAAQQRAFVAITANAGVALNAYANGACDSTVSGLIVSADSLVHPAQPHGPVLYFPRGAMRAVITDSGPPTGGILAAVAGTTTIGNDCDGGRPGTLLVVAGVPGSCALPKSTIVAARGAAGVTRDGKVLILAIVQGNEGSTGVRTADLARLMISLGAWNAVNFDGGGSTAFIWNGAMAPPESRALRRLARPANGDVRYSISWRPSGGRYMIAHCDTCTTYRAVYAELGLRATRHR